MEPLILKGIRDFDLEHTFACGQCFRWNRQPDGSYLGVAHGKVLRLERVDADLILHHVTEEDYQQIWREYLDLDRDYRALKAHLASRDEILGEATRFGHGIRILNQDPWETLVSFLLSQNSNIPRIKQCIEALCVSFGEPISSGLTEGSFEEGGTGPRYFAFPTPERLASLSLSDLDLCRLGYRAKYVLETAKVVALDGGKTLAGLRGGSESEAMEYLLSLCGVGPKVASCIMLFALKQHHSFPVDVWVRKVMEEYYGLHGATPNQIDAFATERFGSHRGFAQQYLFYYIREFQKEHSC